MLYLIDKDHIYILLKQLPYIRILF